MIITKINNYWLEAISGSLKKSNYTPAVFKLNKQITWTERHRDPAELRYGEYRYTYFLLIFS